MKSNPKDHHQSKANPESYDHSFWTPAKIQRLKDGYELEETKNLATELECSVKKINFKAARLGLKKHKFWTKEKIETLSREYHTAAKCIGRSTRLQHRLIQGHEKKN